MNTHKWTFIYTLGIESEAAKEENQQVGEGDYDNDHAYISNLPGFSYNLYVGA